MIWLGIHDIYITSFILDEGAFVYKVSYKVEDRFIFDSSRLNWGFFTLGFRV
jgi:hypothetical protein